MARLISTSIATFWIIGVLPAGLVGQERISRPGFYQGYSSAQYDGFVRTSQYLTMRDGVRIAIDVLRPTKGGVLHAESLPVIWTHHRYHRASISDGTLRTIVDWTAGLREVLDHGYVVAAADTRGGGASFGTQPGFFAPEETKDAYEITEWLARQPWSTGKVGMFGRSYLGITQYFAASQRPPHLAAIFPEMAVFDFYTFIYPGGIYRDNFFKNWQFLTQTLDNSRPEKWFSRILGAAAPVDGDSGIIWRDAAIRAHQTNRDIHELWGGLPFRDSKDPIANRPLHPERSPHASLAPINQARVPAYHLVGWFDAFPRDATLWFANYRGPQKLVIGPWHHSGYEEFDIGAERLRWYDYWLKGIQNGVMSEPAVHYWTLNAPPGQGWRSSRTWPLATERRTTFYFGEGASGSVSSSNDGKLVRTPPDVLRLDPPVGTASAYDEKRIDLTTTSGTANRWTKTYGGDFGYPDMVANDRKGLTYTTDPLEAPVEITGHPVVTLWLTANEPDVDVFAYLEDVAPDGRSTYLTEGALRASHRALALAPYRNFGLPWHPSRAADARPLAPATAAELTFDLHPTSVLFQPGHRIRVTITGADRDNNPVPAEAPTIRLLRSVRYASRIVLPIIPAPRPN